MKSKIMVLKCLMVFVAGVLVSVTQTTAFCADIIVNSYTKATLPAAGTAGRIARVTDDVRGLWIDNGLKWQQVSGEVVNVSEYSSLSAAITDIGSATRVLLIPNAQTVTADLTVPVNVTLCFIGTGIITVNDTVILTVNGSILAGPSQQIFANVGGPDAAKGLVRLGKGTIDFVTPQNFGAKQDGTTDDYNPVMAAIYAGQFTESHIPVQLLGSSTAYMTSATIELPKYTRISGAKSNASIIKVKTTFFGANLMQMWRYNQGSTEDPPATTSGTGYPSHHVFLDNFQLDSNDQAINLIALFHPQEGSYLRDITFQGDRTAVINNTVSRDGIRVRNPAGGDGGNMNFFRMENLIFYGQFRRHLDIKNATMLHIDGLNTNGSNKDSILIDGAQSVGLYNMMILIPQTTTDDSVNTAGIHLKDVNYAHGSNIIIGPSGSSNFTNFDGLFIEDANFPDSNNYIFHSLSFFIPGLGTTQFANSIKDIVVSPNYSSGYVEFFPVYAKQWRETQHGNVYTPPTFRQGIRERERTTALGEWITPTFSAGNFTGNGSMTWTVEAGDVTTYAYTLIGKTMIVAFNIVTTSVSGTPASNLRIAIPGSFVAAKLMQGVYEYKNGTAAAAFGMCRVTAGGTLIELYRGANAEGGNWSTGTNNTAVRGHIVFEVQ